jgi:hypothetical protein
MGVGRLGYQEYQDGGWGGSSRKERLAPESARALPEGGVQSAGLW